MAFPNLLFFTFSSILSTSQPDFNLVPNSAESAILSQPHKQPFVFVTM